MIKNDKNEMKIFIHIFTYFLTYVLIQRLTYLFYHLSFINYSIYNIFSKPKMTRFFRDSVVQVLHHNCTNHLFIATLSIPWRDHMLLEISISFISNNISFSHFRSNRLRMLFKIDVLENFGAGVFLWNLRSF